MFFPLDVQIDKNGWHMQFGAITCLLGTLLLVGGCSRSAPSSSRPSAAVNVHIIKGRQLYDAGRNDEAIAEFTKAIQLDTSSDEAFYGRALAYHNRAFARQEFEGSKPVKGSLDDFNRAISDFNAAITLNSSEPLFFEYRAETWFVKGDLRRALDDCSRAIQLDPNSANAYYNRGEVLAEQEKFDEAIEDLNQALEIQPENTTYYCARGSVFYEMGQLEKALSDFSAAHKISSKHPHPLELRSVVWNAMGKRGRAAADMAMAESLRQNQ